MAKKPTSTAKAVDHIVGNIRAQNLQIELLARRTTQNAFGHLLMAANVLSWVLAACSVGLVFGVISTAAKSNDAFAVTASGEIVQIFPVDKDWQEQVFERYLSMGETRQAQMLSEYLAKFQRLSR